MSKCEHAAGWPETSLIRNLAARECAKYFRCLTSDVTISHRERDAETEIESG